MGTADVLVCIYKYIMTICLNKLYFVVLSICICTFYYSLKDPPTVTLFAGLKFCLIICGFVLLTQVSILYFDVVYLLFSQGLYFSAALKFMSFYKDVVLHFCTYVLSKDNISCHSFIDVVSSTS